VNEALREAAERLRAAGIDSARADARILWAHANNDGEVFQSFIARRLAREPVAYITGHKEFWSLDFAVGPGALIPRPETETLIEEALREVPDRSARLRVLDLGTGSGCLLVALLKEFPNATGTGVDSSDKALRWARENSTRHRLVGRAPLVRGGWRDLTGAFDLVVSNPPYIPSSAIAGLEPEVRNFEPREALDGGADGLAAYREIAPVLAQRLGQKGLGLLEIGAGQHHMVGEILAANGLVAVRAGPDLAGIPRCMVIRAP
jgi:release factor glutamine methyltransferase